MWLLFSFVYLLPGFFFVFFSRFFFFVILLSIKYCPSIIVVDETTEISHSAELQDFRRRENKYTQHYFYLVACQNHLSLFFSFFSLPWGMGVTLRSRKCYPPFVNAYVVDDMNNDLRPSVTLTLKHDHFSDQNVIFGTSPSLPSGR